MWARQLDGDVQLTAVATDSAGQSWLTGSISGRVWLDENALSAAANTGLLLRLSP